MKKLTIARMAAGILFLAVSAVSAVGTTYFFCKSLSFNVPAFLMCWVMMAIFATTFYLGFKVIYAAIWDQFPKSRKILRKLK